MKVDDLVSYLDIEIRKVMSLEEAFILVDNIEHNRQALEEDGYTFGVHFDYDSILRDLLPDFMEDMDIVVFSEEDKPTMFIDDEEWEKEMGR